MNETGSLYLEIWKKSRNSIEHLDRIIGGFRKTIFAIDGVCLSVAASIMATSTPIPTDQKVPYTSVLLILLSFGNCLLWCVEKHYHYYLLSSAKVSKEAEKRLSLPESLQLTSRLSKTKQEQHFLLRSIYNGLYIIPAIISLGTVVAISKDLVHYEYLMWIAAAFFVFEAIFFFWGLIRERNFEQQCY